MQTQSQYFANEVYKLVKTLENASDDQKKKYASWCMRFAPLILQNGLAQTVGFLQIKEEASTFLDHLSVLLCPSNPENVQISRETLTERVIQADLLEYQRLTRKALASAPWFRRYTVSVLGIKTEDLS